MIVDHLTFTFAEGHKGHLPDLAKAIDPGRSLFLIQEYRV
jgi:hypothetical protein